MTSKENDPKTKLRPGHLWKTESPAQKALENFLYADIREPEAEPWQTGAIKIEGLMPAYCQSPPCRSLKIKETNLARLSKKGESPESLMPWRDAGETRVSGRL
jgi:hypothetical protein